MLRVPRAEELVQLRRRHAGAGEHGVGLTPVMDLVLEQVREQPVERVELRSGAAGGDWPTRCCRPWPGNVGAARERDRSSAEHTAERRTPIRDDASPTLAGVTKTRVFVTMRMNPRMASSATENGRSRSASSHALAAAWCGDVDQSNATRNASKTTSPSVRPVSMATTRARRSRGSLMSTVVRMHRDVAPAAS
jgi:hypothetical protein